MTTSTTTPTTPTTDPWGRTIADLRTPWGDKIMANPSQPVLSEYPRPQMVRDSYLNLNGWWKYAILGAQETFLDFQGDILVPFSPESMLSTVRRWVHPTEKLIYQRTFQLSKEFLVGRLLLHFGAVDHTCQVFVNGNPVGSHEGGYLPFEMEIGDFLVDGQNTLRVVVTDASDTSYHSRGKQSSHPGGIWYTPQSGIWQTVWIESVPDIYVQDLRLIPDFDNAIVEVGIIAAKPSTGVVQLFADGVLIAGKQLDSQQRVRLSVKDMHQWTPEDPFLYELRITYGQDRVNSYVAMRKFSVGKDNRGVMRMMLNNQPYFYKGVLDQGYWPDGLYTAPCDAAMVYDIKTMKELGFNMLRKHIKIEPLRWYYHCDRLGMLVWQDMVSGGDRYRSLLIALNAFLKLPVDDRRCRKLTYRQDARGRAQYEGEMEQTIALLGKVPSLAVWVPFNEGWGQFDSIRIAQRIRDLDPTRIIDHASGWYDQGGGDLCSRHVYFRPVRLSKDPRTIVLSEFGGYSLDVAGHVYNLTTSFGYRKFKSMEDFRAAYVRLIGKQIVPLISHGLSATVYTQLSDVEDETNGFITYDRKICKVDAPQMRTLHGLLHLEPQA
ncbi:MAG: glycoside hydrolase family 2 protein [Sphaerochaetaceae bacterium]